ncbi:MAG: hypothetical protein GY951_06170 [Psychromonas sp.]|nr:hypothetical protein [Psychromonas sp.]
MKIARVFITFIIIACCSYASLWYGFAKGYQYEVGENLVDSVTTSKVLTLMREGKNKEAIELLEGMLDTQIIERSVSDREFIKYIIGLPKPDKKVDQRLKEHITQYRKSTNYECTLAKPACEIINGYLYENE